MKYLFNVVLSFFIIGIFLVGGFAIYNYSFERQILLEKTSTDIIKIAEDKMKSIDNYLEEMKKDILILQESNEIKNILRLGLDSSIFPAKEAIRLESRRIAREINAYIITHPNITVSDLQNKQEFWNIAVQPIGNTGYSAVHESDSLINRFHNDIDFVDIDLNSLADNLPEFYKIISENRGGQDADGFYLWEENGKKKQKYMYISAVNSETDDNISLSVAATTYIEDYKIIKNISLNANNFLKQFKENKNYYNLILISPQDYLIYEVSLTENLGEKLGWSENLNEGISKAYFEIKEKQNISFYGPYIGTYGDFYPKISIIAPIYEDGFLLGYVGLINEMDKIFEISTEIEGLGETEESYLINRERLLISSLRLQKFDILVQSIITKNSGNCFNETFPGHFERNESISSFLDYRGVNVLGTHREIINIDWCLLTEIDKQEAINIPLNEFIKKNIYFSLVGVLFLTFIGFFIGIYFDKINKKKIIKKIKNKKYGNIFLSKLKLWHSALFAFIFVIGYFFLVTSFFQGWRNAAVYDEISDLATIFILILLLFYGFKLKNNSAGKFIVFGSLLAIIDKLIQIILEEYIFEFGFISAFYWIPGIIIGFIGLFLIFFGFREVKC